MQTTLMPFLFSNAAVTPSPSTNLSENDPSKILPHPQEGLLSVSNASVAPTETAIFKVAWAPFTNSLVTSTPCMFSTFVLPSITSAPVPFWISDGTRGTVNPPRTSGQTGNRLPFLNSSSSSVFSQFLPSKLQLTPNKQALTSFMTQNVLKA